MSSGRSLWLWEHLPKNIGDKPDQSWLKEGDAVENINRLEMGGHQAGSFASINSGSRFPQTIQHDLDLLDLINKLAKPGAKVNIVQAVTNESVQGLVSANKLVSQIKLAGLINVKNFKPVDVTSEQLGEICQALSITDQNSNIEIVEIECSTPDFANGSSKPLSFASKIKDNKPKPEKKVWSLADMDDDDVDLIDQDDLLDEEDLVKPDQASLRVCGTTGKRKACKDCSCGLAEELSTGKEPTKKSFTSSCGSCYLGDAFRCASCPYLGMAAFKPGEKIQLSDRQLKADQ